MRIIKVMFFLGLTQLFLQQAYAAYYSSAKKIFDKKEFERYCETIDEYVKRKLRELCLIDRPGERLLTLEIFVSIMKDRCPYLKEAAWKGDLAGLKKGCLFFVEKLEKQVIDNRYHLIVVFLTTLIRDLHVEYVWHTAAEKYEEAKNQRRGKIFKDDQMKLE